MGLQPINIHLTHFPASRAASHRQKVFRHHRPSATSNRLHNKSIPPCFFTFDSHFDSHRTTLAERPFSPKFINRLRAPIPLPPFQILPPRREQPHRPIPETTTQNMCPAPDEAPNGTNGVNGHSNGHANGNGTHEGFKCVKAAASYGDRLTDIRLGHSKPRSPSQVTHTPRSKTTSATSANSRSLSQH